MSENISNYKEELLATLNYPEKETKKNICGRARNSPKRLRGKASVSPGKGGIRLRFEEDGGNSDEKSAAGGHGR